jgi:GH15 family glucan-1,4-alpha-glucosidase
MTRPAMSTASHRIGDYALLGDTRSAALVSPDGDIDWWCLPRFDSSPVCGRLVGGPQAGHLGLGPATPATVTERDYLPGAPVLCTRWHSQDGPVTLTEGMVSVVRGRLLPSTPLVRRIEAHERPVRIRWALAPRAGWRNKPLRRRGHGSVTVLTHGPLALSVHPSLALPGDSPEGGELTLPPCHHLDVAISAVNGKPLVHVPPDEAWQLLMQDADQWREWTAQIPNDLPFTQAARHSAMVLRLLTHSPTGAPVGCGDDVPSRSDRGLPQLGLPLHLAARRQHRGRGVRRAGHGGGGSHVPALAAAREQAGPATPAGAADPRRT